MTDSTLSPVQVITESLKRPSSPRTPDRILNDLHRAGYEVVETRPTPLNDRIILAGRNMRPWFTTRADAILDRIKTESPEDVMLYHDAVGVLVAARSLIELVAAGALDDDGALLDPVASAPTSEGPR